MQIRYKSYEGMLIYSKRIKNNEFKFRIQDMVNDVIVEFIADINDIRLTNCIGNSIILSEITK